MDDRINLIVLVVAAWLDFVLGDPWDWLHPVQVMGWVISQYTSYIFKYVKSPLLTRIFGVFLALILIIGSGLTGWLISIAASLIHPILGIIIASILLASCFAGRSLRDAAIDVLQSLLTDDLVTARSRLSRYVGRDTENLSKADIYRAILETVAENAVDGVTAPLFYAIVGSFIGIPFAAVGFALAYKAASTLDSMVGYKEAPFQNFGWFSARLDDFLTWLPCRLTVLTLASIYGKFNYVWQICRRDAVKDPSPNSGWSECAYAAILGVQLGGTNYYRGVAKEKPLLGQAFNPIDDRSIREALKLTRTCFLIWLTIAVVLLAIRVSDLSNLTLFKPHLAFFLCAFAPLREIETVIHLLENCCKDY